MTTKKKKNPRGARKVHVHNLNFRADPWCVEAIRANASQAKMTMSEWLRSQALKPPSKQKAK